MGALAVTSMQGRVAPDHVIRNGLVVTQEGCARRDIWVTCGRIAAVAPAHTITPDGVTIFDASGRLVIPGLVNAHTHGHANLMKGVADRWTLEASLTNGPWLGGGRTPDLMYLSTLIGAVDMALKGVTACFDLVYEFPCPTVEGFNAVARAYADVGLRAVLAPMVADKTLFEAIPGLASALPDDVAREVSAFNLTPTAELRVRLGDIVAARGDLPAGISLAMAPTIPHHCSAELLAACADLATRHDLILHMHIAESRLQAVVAREQYGMSAVRYLAQQKVLREGFVAAHAVWLDDGDLDVLAAHACVIAHIPASNFRLGSGIAPVRAMLDRGIAVALATDGANSSDALSMFEAMRLASYGSRAYAGPREHWLSAAETFHAATAAGAHVLGLGREIGRIAEGFCADLVFLDLASVNFIPLHDPVNQLVTCEEGSSVVEVMSGGRFIVEGRQTKAVALRSLRDAAQDAIDTLAPRIAASRALAQRLEPLVVAAAGKLAAAPLPMERLVPGRPT